MNETPDHSPKANGQYGSNWNEGLFLGKVPMHIELSQEEFSKKRTFSQYREAAGDPF